MSHQVTYCAGESSSQNTQQLQTNPSVFSAAQSKAIQPSARLDASVVPTLRAALSAEQQARLTKIVGLSEYRAENKLAGDSGRLSIHQQNRENVAAKIQQWLADEPALDKLAPQLLKILLDAKFDPSAYEPYADGVHDYSRYLLYSNPDEKNPFCLQIFCFGPGQYTPIHDHPCYCASLVFQGEGGFSEVHYEEVLGESTEQKFAREQKRVLREQGSVGIFDLSQPNIHSLRNDSSSNVVTVHLYKMDGIEATKRIACKQKYTEVGSTL